MKYGYFYISVNAKRELNPNKKLLVVHDDNREEIVSSIYYFLPRNLKNYLLDVLKDYGEGIEFFDDYEPDLEALDVTKEALIRTFNVFNFTEVAIITVAVFKTKNEESPCAPVVRFVDHHNSLILVRIMKLG